MHQVGHAGDRHDLHARGLQAIDECPVDLRRRRHRDRLRVVLVEHQTDGDAAFDSGVESGKNRIGRRRFEAEIVDGDIERLGGAVEKCSQPLRYDIGSLASVGEEIEVEWRAGGYCAPAFGSPVCSRGSSTSIGSGRVAISAASSGSSVSVINFKSYGAMAPDSSTVSFIQSRRPLQ